MNIENLTALINEKDGLSLLFGKHRQELTNFQVGATRAFEGTGYKDGNTKDFLDAFTHNVANEKKALAESRAAALRDVRRGLDEMPQKIYDFDLHEYLFQLAVRVREPNLIDQRKAGWCPMNAPLIHLARTLPLEYVKFAINMWNMKERIPFRGAKVQHAPDLRQEECYKLEMESVDYIMLKSLMHTFFPQRKEAATSEQLAAALGHCGFAAEVVQNSGWGSFPGLLDKAANVLRNRDSILITMTAAAFVENFHEPASDKRSIKKRAEDPGAWARGIVNKPRHFTLITKLEHNEKLQLITKLKIYTWGRSYGLVMPYATLYNNLYEVVVARQKEV